MDSRMKGRDYLTDKRREPLFRLKDSSDRVMLKMKDQEGARAMVSKLRDKTLYIAEPNQNKFRSTSKNSSGIQLMGNSQRGSTFLGAHPENSMAEKTSREITNRKGDFSIKSNKNSFRFKTQE